MKLYRITYQDRQDNLNHEWFGTQADFKKRLREFKDDMNSHSEKGEMVEVPVDKAGLLAFLNTTDNFTPEKGVADKPL